VPQLKVPQFILIDCGKRLSNAVPNVRAPISLHKSAQSEYMPNTLKQKKYLIKKGGDHQTRRRFVTHRN
jgi:hypothetical protein